jgi:eukaryotic-like serine/threonine-protein kinase
MEPADDREESIFREALQRAKGPEREAFLSQACAGNAALHARLQALLQAHESPDPLLEPLGRLPHNATVVLPPVEGVGTLIGRYKLLEKIGEGGFGFVYVAEQREPVKRRVALKIIKLGMDTRQVVARFEAERQALALMDHPNIAKVLDAGATDTGRPYFVMELVKGIPITQYCDQEKLGTRERLDLFIKICHAIQHAHQKGIIHRDIKPSNIVVTLHDGVPVPKVIDFGIAKATQQELTEKTVYTQFQQFIGTPAYMSPEQAEMSGLDIDTRSDIYSLGVLLYELLTGSTPFETKELLQSGLDEMRKIIPEREPARPSTRLRQTTSLRISPSQLSALNSALSTDLDWIVMKCLEKDRVRRYETANSLAHDIERHLKHEPVVARPPSMGYRLQKSFRRHKLAYTAAGVVVLVLALGVMVSSWQAIRATTARRDEAAARLRADEAARVAERQRRRAEKGEQRARENELAARQNLYAADMNVAFQAWKENNLGLALELLGRQRPGPQEPDLRGWEWRYLWGLCQGDALYTLGWHSKNEGGVFGLAISPDDRLLAGVCIGSGEVGIWDVDSRGTIDAPKADDARGSVAFSPDGKLLAFAPSKQGVKLWDIQQRREIGLFPGEHSVGFGRPAMGFSPSGRQLAVGTKEGPVVLWVLATHTAGRTLKGHLQEINSLAFSTDGLVLVTGGWDGTVRAWSLTNGQGIAVFTNHTHRVQCVALSPDNTTVASGSWDKTIRIWDLLRQRQASVLTNHTGWVSALAFSSDGKTLASASADYLIKLWETRTWREASTLKGSLDEVWGMAFSSDGKTLFSSGKDGKVLVWNGRPRAPATQVLKRPDDAQAFWLDSPSGIPVCRRSATYNLWDPLSLRKLPEHPYGELERLTNDVNATVSPGGKCAAISTTDGPIWLWDVEQERQIARLPGLLSDAAVVGFSPDGKVLARVAPGKCLKVWNLEKLEEVATLPKSVARPSTAPWFAPKGDTVAVGNADGTVEVWDILRKDRVANWKAHRDVVTGVAFMPDGKKLVTVSTDHTARLWNVETQREVWSFGRALNAFYSVAVSPDGKRIAGGTWDQSIKIWNAHTGHELATLKGIHDWLDPNLRGRWDAVSSLVFLPPDGNTLISGTQHEVRIWRAPSWEEIAAAEKRTEGKTQ